MEVRAQGGTCVAMPVDVFDAVALRNLVKKLQHIGAVWIFW